MGLFDILKEFGAGMVENAARTAGRQAAEVHKKLDTIDRSTLSAEKQEKYDRVREKAYQYENAAANAPEFADKIRSFGKEN